MERDEHFGQSRKRFIAVFVIVELVFLVGPVGFLGRFIEVAVLTQVERFCLDGLRFRSSPERDLLGDFVHDVGFDSIRGFRCVFDRFRGGLFDSFRLDEAGLRDRRGCFGPVDGLAVAETDDVLRLDRFLFHIDLP